MPRTVLDQIHERIADGYKIFVRQFEDGREYILAKQTDERTKSVFCTLSSYLSCILVAQYGPSVHAGIKEYFGKRTEHVEGENVILYFNINEGKFN